MAQNWPILYFFRNFFVFSGPNPGWAILYFLRNFFVFLGFRGFWALSQLRKHARLYPKNASEEPRGVFVGQLWKFTLDLRSPPLTWFGPDLDPIWTWNSKSSEPKGPSRTVFSTESDSVAFYNSVVNLLRIVIHYSKYSKSVQNVVIH